MTAPTVDGRGRARNGAVELEWRRDGADGEPLLLISGLGSPLVAFEQGFVDQLVDAGFAVLRFDNRDAGKSSNSASGYTLGDMAEDAVAVLDAAGWSTAHVMGMSMGGMIAQQLGIDHGGRLRSMTSLMSTTSEPDVGRSTPEAGRALMAPAPADRAGWIAHRLETEQLWVTPGVAGSDWNQSKAELLFDYGVNPDGVRRQYQAILASGSRAEGLARIDVPTLVLHGSEDTLIQPDGGERTAELVPGARYVVIDGMGHDLPPMFWPRIVEELRAFCQ